MALDLVPSVCLILDKGIVHRHSVHRHSVQWQASACCIVLMPARPITAWRYAESPYWGYTHEVTCLWCIAERSFLT